MTVKELEEKFAALYGPVKSARLSMTIDSKTGKPVNLGYGFVCFEKKEDAVKALEA